MDDVKTMQQIASDKAKAKLKSMGILYPSYDTALGPEGNYKALMDYRAMEANLTIDYMRMPSGPRPLSFDSTKKDKKNYEPVKKWGGYND